MRRAVRPLAAASAATALLLACTAPPEAVAPSSVELDPPSRPGALAPSLATHGDSWLLTWLEPLPGGRHRLLFSRLRSTPAGSSDEGWSEPVTVVEGEGFFANWADVPGVGATPGGDLVAYWLAKTAEETYAYSIELARSTDGGASWRPMGRLNDDATHTEHGFVSLWQEEDGLGAVWLDGRRMAQDGPMTLRTAPIGGSVGESSLVDDRVCECCPTSATMTPSGPLIVYRDRDPSELRNIGVARRLDHAWSTGRIHDDGWRIAGCPVNGPSVDSLEDRVAVAWFTAPEGVAQVLVGFSEDGGASFGVPVRLDRGRPLGRVGLVLTPEGALVSWISMAEERGRVALRRVHPDGRRGQVTVVAETDASRAAGIPRLALTGDRILVVWVDAEEEAPRRLRARAYEVATL